MLFRSWYVIIQTEQEVYKSKREGQSVGIDLGLNSFAVDSDGAVIENPRFYERNYSAQTERSFYNDL